MFEKIYLGSVILFFLLAFAIKNIKTALSTGVSIKGKSTKVTISIVFSTIVYLGIILRIFFIDGNYFFELKVIDIQIIDYLSYAIISLGFILGISALISIKSSWRVGIKHEQKTELITTGIYKFSRNPYFLSYFVLMFGFIIKFPSPFLILPYIGLLFIFHSMILEEEKYLEGIHGEAYFNYINKVNRYITIIKK